MLPIHNIIQPTDFSRPSEFAFNIAAALARDYGAQLWVVHVSAPPTALFAEGLVMPTADEIAEELHNYVARLPTPPEVQVGERLVRGQAVEEILAVAQELHADLIVLGTHGRRGWSRLLMGSVAEQVLRRATCPVLTVKQPLPSPTTSAGNAPASAMPALTSSGSHQMDGI